MKITCKLEIKDNDKILHQFGLNKNGDVNLYMANRAFQRMQKYVPYREGALSLTVTIEPNKVIYEQPYAHAQYVGKTKGTVKNYTTPGTGKHWDRKMWSAEGDLLTQEVAAYTKAKGGG